MCGWVACVSNSIPHVLQEKKFWGEGKQKKKKLKNSLFKVGKSLIFFRGEDHHPLKKKKNRVPREKRKKNTKRFQRG